MKKTITQSLFLHFLHCSKRGWLEHQAKNNPDSDNPISLAQTYRILQRKHLLQLAQAQFPDGHCISGAGEEAIAQTQEALDRKEACVFSPAFETQKAGFRCDILQRMESDRWSLIAVHASTGIKPGHLWGLAFQRYLLETVGHIVQNTTIFHISKDCQYPRLSNLLTSADVTEDVGAMIAEMPALLQELECELNQPHPSHVSIGKHCHQPYPCSFTDHCWKDIPEPTIFSIPRLSKPKQRELIEQDIIAIADLPEDFPLTQKQQDYVDLINCDRPKINWPAIRDSLNTLTYPLYFLDFETCSLSIPRFEETHPYDIIPFQYSCHILTKSGERNHREYLHQDTRDPRPTLISSLLKHIKPQGSVVVYNKSFEKSVIQKLAHHSPQQASALNEICDRLWDLADIFKYHYQDPAFQGSASLKKVLPVLVDLNYDQLEIQAGNDAPIIWDLMIQRSELIDSNQAASDLRAYNQLDTLAMVKLYQFLREHCDRTPT